VPIAAGAVALAIAIRPPIARHGWAAVDLALCACLSIAAFQLAPLPPSIRTFLSPGTIAMDHALRFAVPGHPRLPLTVDRAASAQAVLLLAAVALFFWSARTLLDGHGVRRSIHLVALCGLAAAATSILQHNLAPRLLYGVWRPVTPNAQPYSPFVNRNDLAAWFVMAIPLTLGYLVGRIVSRRRAGPLPLQGALDDKGVWLMGALGAMIAGLMATLSRSGLIAGLAALVSFLWLSGDRLGRRGRVRLALSLGFAIIVATMYVNLGAMMSRLNDTVANGVGGRREIWTITWTMIRDFWLTGVGVGGYARAMSVYQPPHVFAFNHAHDEYLQLLAEGGVLLAAAALVAAVAGAAQAARRLRQDRTAMFWMRAGALSAIIAIATQSLWDTSLRMPANALLCALCCAIALHGSADA